jgi:hypothetical protein
MCIYGKDKFVISHSKKLQDAPWRPLLRIDPWSSRVRAARTCLWSMCVYIYVCVCMYVYICTHVDSYNTIDPWSSQVRAARTCLWSMCVCICIYVCMYVCMYVYICTHVDRCNTHRSMIQSGSCCKNLFMKYLCIYVYMCVCMYVCIHMYTCR